MKNRIFERELKRLDLDPSNFLVEVRCGANVEGAGGLDAVQRIKYYGATLRNHKFPLLCGGTTMKNLVLAICVIAFITGSGPALADLTDPFGQMLIKPLTAEETAKARAERDAAKAKWNAMTPDEKAAVTRSMRGKKLVDLNAMERVAQDDDLTGMTASDTAQAKAERAAAQAKYAQMTPEEKAALRKSASQKRFADLNAMERVGQENDIRQYMSY